jgi:hypothetical protein
MVGDMKRCASTEIIRRKYMTICKGFAPRAKHDQAATARIASRREK